MRHLHWFALSLCSLAFLACPPVEQQRTDGGVDGGHDVPTTCAGGFCAGPLVDHADPTLPHFSATLRSDDTIGVAYFTVAQRDSQSRDVYEIHYVEWKNGAVTEPVKIETGRDTGNQPLYQVLRETGVALAYQGNGEPAIAFLGGFDPDTQSFWYQHDAYLATRSGGAWTSQAVVRLSEEAFSPDSPPSNSGFVVGVDPALAWDATNSRLIYAYRDVHNGQSNQGDYNGADLEVAIGSGTTWQHKIVVDGDGKVGYGGHTQIVMVNGLPAIVGDQISNSPSSPPGISYNLLYYAPRSDLTWAAPKTVMSVSNTQSGPAFAWDSQLGYAAAVVEKNGDKLSFLSSATGSGVWTTPFPVWQSGTGGWYPSLAIDPTFHEPHIAYYFCDSRVGIADNGCRLNDDELRIEYRVEGTWRRSVVDTGGGYRPKLFFLSSGKRVVVYRAPQTAGTAAGTLKIAVEQ